LKETVPNIYLTKTGPNKPLPSISQPWLPRTRSHQTVSPAQGCRRSRAFPRATLRMRRVLSRTAANRSFGLVQAATLSRGSSATTTGIFWRFACHASGELPLLDFALCNSLSIGSSDCLDSMLVGRHTRSRNRATTHAQPNVRIPLEFRLHAKHRARLVTLASTPIGALPPL